MCVVSWDGPQGVLFVKIAKGIGPESGLVTFVGVSHVNLPPKLEVSGIETGTLDDLPSDLLKD